MPATADGGLFLIALGMAGAESPSGDKDQMLVVAAERNDVVLARRLFKEGGGVADPGRL
jgi:hypothetical protein